MTTFPKNLITSNDLTSEHLYKIFSLAQEYEKVEESINNEQLPAVNISLKGVTVALVFFENSTRTRLSFELAAKRLGAEVITFTANTSSLSKGESLADTIRTIDAMFVDMYVIRSQWSGVPTFVSNITKNIIVNAGDGKHEHPTQALLDAYTIYKYYKKFKGLKISIIGDILHSRVARSNIITLKTLGADVRLLGPGTLLPVHTNCWGLEIHNNIDEAVEWSDAIIMLRIQNERMDTGFLPSLKEYVRFYQLNLQRFSKKNKIILLHPGPVNYGVELDKDVTLLHNSMINQQVSNGVLTRMALMTLLVRNI